MLPEPRSHRGQKDVFAALDVDLDDSRTLELRQHGPYVHRLDDRRTIRLWTTGEAGHAVPKRVAGGDLPPAIPIRQRVRMDGDPVPQGAEGDVPLELVSGDR